MIIPQQQDLFTIIFTWKYQNIGICATIASRLNDTKKIEIYWQRGVDNEAYYFTKYHATVYHRNMWIIYIRDKIQCLELNTTSQLKKWDIISLRRFVDPAVTAGSRYQWNRRHKYPLWPFGTDGTLWCPYPQKPTPIRNDNSTATGFIYDNIHMKISKYWDMRYYCFKIEWHKKNWNLLAKRSR